MNKQYVPERAMFIYAHPDDIEFGCAGTAAKWAKYGCEVTYVLLTSGNVGTHDPEMTREKLAEVREAEQTAAANIAGVTNMLFLRYDDGLLVADLELRKRLVKLIRIHKPNVVVCGDPTVIFRGDRINHPDHRAAGKAAIDAVFPSSEMRLLHQEFEEEGIFPHKVNYVYVTTHENPNYYEDISETIETKIEALRQHAPSQFAPDWDPADRVKEWAAEIGREVGFKYAERFRRMVLEAVKPKEEEGNQ